MEYFGNAETIEELKGDYKNYLVRLKGDEDALKEMNEQYKEILVELAERLNIQIEEENKELPIEQQKKKIDVKNDRYAETLQKVIDFNMDIEIIGQWIWCFNSYEYREQLKDLGFWYSSSKKAWVFNGFRKKMVKTKNRLEDVRKKYGTEKIREREEQSA